MRIGLIELPVIKLIDSTGKNWINSPRYPVLISKQILMSNLEGGGFETHLVNLKDGTYEEEYGQVLWRNMTLKKIISGRRISQLDPNAYDAWGVTVNFTQERELACMVIEHLARGGKPVVVGGSDTIAVPDSYLQAGAAAVITDKSGAANWSVFDYVLGRTPREKLTGVILADGRQFPKKIHPLSPEDWPLPSLQVVKQCLGTEFYDVGLGDAFFPQGSVMPDLGCDRKCDFCQTPTYKLGYKRMSPKTALKWFALQKEAGARAVQNLSDQFLGRVLFGEEGRKEVLEIMAGLRQMELPVSWLNGLEIKKMTLGRGRERDSSDLIPDEELIETIYGWDGKVGCFNGFIPAERPVMGRESYAKLLPWKQHCDMLKRIVKAGVPSLYYGVIVGLSEDSHESLQYLEEAVSELYQELKTINPSLQFMLLPFSINPIPGTPQEQNLRKLDLIRTEDVTILGSTWTASADTRYLSYEEVSDWQLRLLQVGESGYSSEVNLKGTTTSKSNLKDKVPQASVLH